MKLSLILVGVLGSVLYFGGLIPGTGAAGPATDHARLTCWGDGKPKSSETWIDGERRGPATEWYANGTKKDEGNYVAGERDGHWLFWNENGELDLSKSGDYSKGRKLAD